jgi:hypothetical protein
MTDMNIVFRPIEPDDDFELIDHLYYITHIVGKQQWMDKHKITYRKENLKRLIFPDLNDSKAVGPTILKRLSMSGFVAVINGVIRASATVGISSDSHNGFIDFGFIQDGDFMLRGLIECCAVIVKEAGGTRLYQTTNMPLGQIRSDHLTLLESQGFHCNQFYHVFVEHRHLGSWEAPENLDLRLIKIPSKMEIDVISTILEEDREFFLAEEFRGNFSRATPDHVFLCLYDENEAIKGIAYYKVWEENESYTATAFGLHFRPKYEVARAEIRQIIQATLLSMKQIGVTAAWSRVSSQNFYTILELSAEGFELSPSHTVMMVKTV